MSLRELPSFSRTQGPTPQGPKMDHFLRTSTPMPIDHTGYADRLRALSTDKRINALLRVLRADVAPTAEEVMAAIDGARARTLWNARSVQHVFGRELDRLERAALFEVPAWPAQAASYAAKLSKRVGTKHRNGSRLTALMHELEAAAPSPQTVLAALRLARKRTRRFAGSIESKYGGVLDDLESATSRPRVADYRCSAAAAFSHTCTWAPKTSRATWRSAWTTPPSHALTGTATASYWRDPAA